MVRTHSYTGASTSQSYAECIDIAVQNSCFSSSCMHIHTFRRNISQLLTHTESDNIIVVCKEGKLVTEVLLLLDY